jgi:hypothetical protein
MGVVVVSVVGVLLIALFLLVGTGCGCSKHIAPQVTFQYEVVEGEGHPDRLNITHYGGDSIANERLYVTSDIRFRAVSGESTADNTLNWKELGDDGEEIGAGDSVLLEPTDPELSLYEATFDIVWWGTNFDGELVRMTIDRWEGADAEPTPSPRSATVGSPPAPTERATRTPWQTEMRNRNSSDWTAEACEAYIENASTTDTPAACQHGKTTAVSTTAPS